MGVSPRRASTLRAERRSRERWDASRVLVVVGGGSTAAIVFVGRISVVWNEKNEK